MEGVMPTAKEGKNGNNPKRKFTINNLKQSCGQYQF